MNKYKTLIFDLDDTLTNNNESIKYAFLMTLNHLGLEYNEELFINWKNFDNNYWHTWESGKLFIPDYIKTLEEKIIFLRANRFKIFFKNLNLTFEAAISLNELYTNMLSVNIVEIKNAYKLIKDLYLKKYEILIATNGPQNPAIEKTKKINIYSYISEIISSELVGFSKPAQEFFDYLIEKCKNKDKNKTLIIGDGLSTDILGGMNYGIDTCWFNPNKNSLPLEYNPTYQISHLLELKRKL